MKKEEIKINDFMDTFIAVCYIKEINVLNIDILNKYLYTIYGNNCDISILGVYVNRGILSKIDGYDYLLKINNNIPLDVLLENKIKYINELMQHISNYEKIYFRQSQKVYETFDDNLDAIISYTKSNYVKKTVK